MSVLLYIDASFRVNGDGSDMQNDFLLQERMEEWVGIYGNRVTEDTERSWRSEAVAFMNKFSPYLEGNQ